jgi:hypothetical protein
VSGSSNVGGLVGLNDGGTVSNSFWDNETSGLAASDGGTGKTTDNMKYVRTYTDNAWSTGLTTPWDFVYNPYYDENNENIWNIHPIVNDGYPFLTALITQPYIITTVEQLQAMNYDLTASYALVNDIDASATIGWENGFLPVGTDANNKFTGRFDGRGYKIINLYINHPYIDRPTTDNVGLFGCVGSGGVVENVGLENENINSYWAVGGLVGWDIGTVSNSYATGSVSSSIETHYYSGDVGGLVGHNEGTVSNSYSTGSVSGDNEVGGLVGRNIGTVSNCYSTGSVSGSGHSVGGLVGYNWYGTVSNCYSAGSVKSGYVQTGGLVGANGYGTVTNSYATGSVSGIGIVGGLVGYNYGTVSNCYSTGSVSGTSAVSGLVGLNAGTVTNSFWDIETSGLATSTGGTGKTTDNMKYVRTYTDNTWSVGLTTPWDFVGNPYGDVGNEDIWNINPAINDGYPFLTVFDTTAPPIPTLIAPANGAVISDNTPTFVWTSVTDPSGVTYQIQIGDNVVIYYAVNLTDNTHTLPDENALALGTYYWHVRAKDGAGNVGDWSGEWNFTVVPIGAIGVLLMPLLLLLPLALILRRQNRRYRY